VADAVRTAGGDQFPDHDGVRPPPEQLVSITLTRAQGQFAVGCRKKGIATYESIFDENGNLDCQETAQLGRVAVAAIGTQL
jgi:hypothetical protein